MKKRIAVTLTVMLLLSVISVGAYAEESAPAQNTILYGDADGDGTVSIIDATRIQRHLADFSPPVSEENMKAALVSGDKALSVIDATLIQRLLAGIINVFPVEEQVQLPTEKEDTVMKMTINDIPVTVEWEDNEAVAALREAVKEKTVTINMSMYGGFEQVGSLGMSLPRNDVRITTSPGDIVLYSGDQMVVFYGSNSWAYTRLGHITDKTQAELTQLLSNGNVSMTLTL